MAENTSEVVTGGVVILAALGFLAYAAQGTGLAGSAAGYDLSASFRSVEGITVGTDVRLAGVKVGTVTALDLNPQTFFADARINVRDDLVLPDDSGIAISSEGLLGGNFVELLPGGSVTNLAPGAEIEDTQGAVSLIGLLLKFVGGQTDADPAAPAAAASPAP